MILQGIPITILILSVRKPFTAYHYSAWGRKYKASASENRKPDRKKKTYWACFIICDKTVSLGCELMSKFMQKEAGTYSNSSYSQCL